MKEQHGGVHTINLSISACQVQEAECHGGNGYLSSITKRKQLYYVSTTFNFEPSIKIL